MTVPWALGYGDPVRERVEARGQARRLRSAPAHLRAGWFWSSVVGGLACRHASRL